jgi:hypothetical protein
MIWLINCKSELLLFSAFKAKLLLWHLKQATLPMKRVHSLSPKQTKFICIENWQLWSFAIKSQLAAPKRGANKIGSLLMPINKQRTHCQPPLSLYISLSLCVWTIANYKMRVHSGIGAFSVIEIQQKCRSHTRSFFYFFGAFQTLGQTPLCLELALAARTLHLMCVFRLFGINYLARKQFRTSNDRAHIRTTLCAECAANKVKWTRTLSLPLHISLKYGLCLFALQSANSSMKRAFLFISRTRKHAALLFAD